MVEAPIVTNFPKREPEEVYVDWQIVPLRENEATEKPVPEVSEGVHSAWEIPAQENR